MSMLTGDWNNYWDPNVLPPNSGQQDQVTTTVTTTVATGNAPLGNAIYRPFQKITMLPEPQQQPAVDWTQVLEAFQATPPRVVRPRKQRQPKLLPVPGRTGRAIKLSGPLTD